MRASIEGVKDVNNDKYIMKSRGKLEYQTEILRTSDLDYSYILDDSDTYSTDITPGDGIGLNHIINGEIGFDVKMGQYDLFIIYERNQKIDYGHTDNIYIALGYLPGNTIEYALSLKGSENFFSNLSVDKNFKNLILSLSLLMIWRIVSNSKLILFLTWLDEITFSSLMDFFGCSCDLKIDKSS